MKEGYCRKKGTLTNKLLPVETNFFNLFGPYTIRLLTLGHCKHLRCEVFMMKRLEPNKGVKDFTPKDVDFPYNYTMESICSYSTV